MYHTCQKLSNSAKMPGLPFVFIILHSFVYETIASYLFPNILFLLTPNDFLLYNKHILIQSINVEKDDEQPIKTNTGQ